MDLIKELNKYLNKGTIETSSLIRIIPKSEYDDIVIEFIRACDNGKADFEILGEGILFKDQCGNGYQLFITPACYEFGIEKPMTISLDKLGSCWIE